MKRLWNFFLNVRHLVPPTALLIAGIVGFVALRGKMIPESYGKLGAYRATALDDLAARPSYIQADHVCLECHTKVKEERADTLHQAVRCFHCHGQGHAHVAHARKAKEVPDAKIDPAQPWDGNFMTKIDLFITKDRATCLSCHEAVVGMPKDFRKINVAEHLKEQGAESPLSRETCFECHGGHNTKP